MENNDSCCCAPGRKTSRQDCAICGKPLVYFSEEKQMECAICHKMKPANVSCEAGHFVCDDCHSGGGAAVLALLQASDEKDPVALLLRVMALKDVHLHGPEHHGIVPCVLLTAYRNCGGAIDLAKALPEAWRRGRKIPGGACGYLGVCGAAAGAGVFAGVVAGATPLSETQWAIPQKLTAECLKAMTEIGGPRCCKRTSRLAVECAAAFSAREFGVFMPVSRPSCAWWAWNNECIRDRCPFFPQKRT